MNNSSKQQRSWHVKRRRDWRDPRRGLRTIERYVQDIVTMQPNPPRNFNTWYVIRHQLYTRTLLAVLSILIVLGIGGYTFTVRSATAPFDIRYSIGAVLLIVGLIGVLRSQLVEPTYRWWLAVRHGHATTANIKHVTRQTLHYGEVVEGWWNFIGNGIPYETRFRLDNDESGYWIWRMAEGNQVYVLVHPTKGKVLIAIGLVETELSVQQQAKDVSASYADSRGNSPE